MATTNKPSYTSTTAFLEALTLAGVEVVFCNLGSDHPSFLEAVARYEAGQGHKEAIKLPKFISVTQEMVALSMAQGYYLATGKMAGVIVHVDVGLLTAGGAIHNVYRSRVPVIIFTGLSSWTVEGELRGSRSEFINWVQDVHDQPGIVRSYTKYTYEFRTGRNIGQVTMRAAQIAMSEPRGPVYLKGAREVMEEELPLPPVKINPLHWQPVRPAALLLSDAKKVAEILMNANKPLIISSWAGNSHTTFTQLLALCERLSIPYLDSAPFAVNFPTTHPLYIGSHWTAGGQNAQLAEADVVLILDSDCPYIPMQNKPNPEAQIIHIDSDPLKQPVPLFYVAAELRFAVNSGVALEQINDALIQAQFETNEVINKKINKRKLEAIVRFEKRCIELDQASKITDTQEPQAAAVAIKSLSRVLPEDTLVICEAISNYGVVMDHLGITDSRWYKTAGASSLGFNGGAVGAKIGIKAGDGLVDNGSKDTLVCCITGDGSFMFSVPSTVHHMASKCEAPFLTIILCNGGWRSPKLSALLVHPQGYASTRSADELGVHFGTIDNRPQYAALAVAAAGGEAKAWGARVLSGAPDMEAVFKEAVKQVRGGKSAIVEVIIPEM